MPVFSTTANLHHTTPLPPGVTFSSALTTLQNHDILIRLDPELAHYETLPSDEAMPNTKRYKVTDHMHTLPKGLWDTTVTFESQITNTDDGVEWVIKAPMGLVQQTTWKIVKTEDVEKDKEGAAQGVDQQGEDTRAKDKGEWCLVEDVEIKASRLLVGTVKGKCEENWRGIHARYVGHLKEVPPATA
ncbi:hypothetical protein EJ04DRAFT_516806 [Polyplosphaeria fusca]|uniref:DUF7053 domain-containing protein n=1 Tax=Polyplosphaeria fusca TaxID=682080 RepID=A0A9P4QIX1_9PLEO|nr:hypothetical protein EJ04DRAFT_516806 [Polyplosphaeria fusca]